MRIEIKLIFPKNFEIKINNLVETQNSREIKILEELPPDKSMATPRETSIRKTEVRAPQSRADRMFGFK